MANATQFPYNSREWCRWLESRIATVERSINPTATRIANEIAAALVYGGGGGGTTVQMFTPIGMPVPWLTDVLPAGFVEYNGQLLSRTTYAALFAVLGTKYGAGDGSTTFGTPNLTARTLIGRDTADTTMDVTGETGGAKTHTHPLSSNGWALIRIVNASTGLWAKIVTVPSWTTNTSVVVAAAANASSATTSAVELGGATDAASSMPPFMVARWIARYADVVAPPAGAVGAVVATPSTLVLRDGAGRSQIVAPVAAEDIANKGYVDGKFTDTGWLPLPLHANVVVYGAGTDPIYRVVGNTVTITGAVKPANTSAAALLDGSTGLVIANLPVAIQPTGNDYQPYSICQGSSDNVWLLSYSGGQLMGSRYRSDTPGTSTWMPFSITYNI